MPTDPDHHAGASAHEAQPTQRHITTQGGDYAEGSIDKRQGTFVDGDLITEERAYAVAGLPNPYLGLRAFTAAEQDIFAGRERMVAALVARLAAEDGDRLLFLVGASGSGKSSLARAGLLPALETALRSQGTTAQTLILDHAGRRPASALTRLLTAPTHDQPTTTLLLIDQFEELFSQAEPQQAQQAVTTLLDLVGQSDRPVRIIATMRSDFMPHLLADARFEPFEQRKVVVRAMSEAELTDAIQRPLQVRQSDKRMEPALVARLAQDAAQDAAYLPLLQVTLDDLWRGGELRLSKYTGLADAIQRRADTVYAYRDFDGLQQEPRSPEEQDAIRAMLLDLVRITPGEEQRELRWRRTRVELTHGQPVREQLLADLTRARLLRTDREQITENGEERTVETVDLVHEALLTSWPTLKQAITHEREWLLRRERFLLALQEWQDQGQRDDYLLTGVRLAEAEALQRSDDSVLREAAALSFVTRSVQQRDQQRQHQIRRARMVVAGLSALTVLALIAAGIAWWLNGRAQQSAAEAMSARNLADSQAATAVASNAAAVAEKVRADSQTQIAEQRAQVAQIGQLAAQALAIQENFPIRSVLLAATAFSDTVRYQVDQPAATQSLYDTLAFVSGEPLGQLPGGASDVRYSPDDTLLAVAGRGNDQHALLRLWHFTLNEHVQKHEDILLPVGSPESLLFSPDSRWLTIIMRSVDGKSSMVVLIDCHSATPPHDQQRFKLFSDNGYYSFFRSAAQFSPDSQWLVFPSQHGDVQALYLPSMQLQELPRSGHAVDFSQNGQYLATGDTSNQILIWERTSNGFSLVRTLTSDATMNNLRALAFSPDMHWLATNYERGFVLWNLFQQDSVPYKAYSCDECSGMQFRADSQMLFAAHIAIQLPEGDVVSEPKIRAGVNMTGLAIIRGYGVATSFYEGQVAKILFDFFGAELRSRTFDGWGGGSGQVSPNEKWLAVPKEQTVALWDLDWHGGPLLYEPLELHGHDTYVSAIAFSNNSHWLVGIGRDGMVQRWELSIASLQSSVPIVVSNDVATVSVDQRWIMSPATFSKQKIVRPATLYELDSKHALPQSHDIITTTKAVMISSDSHWLLMLSPPVLQRLDEPGQPKIVLDLTDTNQQDWTFSPDSHWLVGTNTAWHLPAQGLPSNAQNLSNQPYNESIFSPDSRWLALSSNSSLQLFSVDSQHITPVIAFPEVTALPKRGNIDLLHEQVLRFSPNSRWLVIGEPKGSKGNTVVLYDLQESGPITVHSPTNTYSAAIDEVLFSSNSGWIMLHSQATQNHPSEVQLVALPLSANTTYRLEGATSIYYINNFQPSGLFSPDGRWLVTGYYGRVGQLAVWDLQHPEHSPSVLKYTAETEAVQFSPDSQQMAVGYDNGTILIWETQQLEAQPRILHGHTKRVSVLLFSQDGKMLISGDNRQLCTYGCALAVGTPTIRVWNLSNQQGSPILTLTIPHANIGISDLELTQDKNWLIASVSSRVQLGGTLLYPLTPRALIAAACQVAGRDLSAEEWQQYMPATRAQQPLCAAMLPSR